MGSHAQATSHAVPAPPPKSSPQEPLHDRLSLREMVEKVRPLSKEEWQARFVEGKSDFVRYFIGRRFPEDATFTINGRIFGVVVSANPFAKAPYNRIQMPDAEALKAFIFQLDAAVTRLSGILSPSAYNKGDLYPIELTHQTNMSVPGLGGDQVSASISYVNTLAESFERGDYAQVSAAIQSQYFHEQVHDLRREILDDSRELLPLMGEFLYDSANNEYRSDVFRKMGEEARRALLESGEMESRKLLFGMPSYESEWVILSRILIWEYSRIDPGFSVPKTLEEQLAAVVGLPELYKNIPQESRDAILKKYITMPCEEIERLSAEYGKELGFGY